MVQNAAAFFIIKPKEKFGIVFFDGFDASVQPELWTKEIFEKIFFMMNEHAVLTTYSSWGIERRAIPDAGFRVEKLQGTKGKREMLRAVKT